jgi:serine protease
LFFTGVKYRPIRLLTVISLRIAGRLAALTVLAIVLFAPAAKASTTHAPGELVVRYRAGTTSEERDRIRAAAGVESAGAVDAQTQRVRLDGGGTIKSAATALRSDSRVVHALPNYVASATAFQPNDPGRGTGWASLQWNFVGPFGINLAAAWENAIVAGAPGGQDVVVAVLDTGVAYRTSSDRRYVRAPDLDRRRFVQGRDFVRGSKLPFDRNGHGTFVTGVISQATNNGIGVAGVAYRSKVMPVRVLDHEGKGDVATIARGIRFASRKGARIINMSFEFDSGLTASQIPDVISALRYAYRKGVLLIAAAGNTEDQRVAYPARARNVLAIGATTEHGCLADYSNTGSGLDLVAPGGGADASVEGDLNCHPLEEPGRYIYQYTFRGSSPRKFGLPPGYEGTSMAVPHVSGVAAILIGTKVLGERPTPAAITQRLTSTARPMGAPGYDSLYGWGLLDAGAATAPAQ